MKFLLYPPDALLKSYVECYWVVEGTDIFANRVIPDGCPEIIFHYGDRYQRHEVSGVHLQPFGLAAGQLTRPLTVSPIGRSGVIGIKLKPTGLWRLFGCNMYDLTDETLFLDDVLSIKTETIIDQIKSATTTGERIKCIETFLLSRLPRSRNSPIEGAIEAINAASGNISVKMICEKGNLSVRTLERYFKQAIGLSAKAYARVVRFNHVFQMVQRNSLSRSDVTYLCGYFDQSHFNKEFKEFSGEDPKTYFESNHAFANFFMNR